MDDAAGREIRQLRADVREGLNDLKTAQGGFLPREVYHAHHEAVVHRITALERALEASDARHAAEITTLEARYDAALKALDDQVEGLEAKRIGWWRWVIAMVLVPIVAIGTGVWLGLRK